MSGSLISHERQLKLQGVPMPLTKLEMMSRVDRFIRVDAIGKHSAIVQVFSRHFKRFLKIFEHIWTTSIFEPSPVLPASKRKAISFHM
jgi:hypothetical protein